AGTVRVLEAPPSRRAARDTTWGTEAPHPRSTAPPRHRTPSTGPRQARNTPHQRSQHVDEGVFGKAARERAIAGIETEMERLCELLAEGMGLGLGEGREMVGGAMSDSP